MSEVTETRWIFNVNGCQVEATRTAGRSTFYLAEDDEGRSVSFNERQLPLLTAFLAAMKENPEGTRVVRCRWCRDEMYCNADGRWALTFDNVTHCPQSPVESKRHMIEPAP